MSDLVLRKRVKDLLLRRREGHATPWCRLAVLQTLRLLTLATAVCTCYSAGDSGFLPHSMSRYCNRSCLLCVTPCVLLLLRAQGRLSSFSVASRRASKILRHGERCCAGRITP